jgi:hypothetical protein
MVTANGCGFINVTFGAADPWHTVVVPLMEAEGVGLTVTFVEAWVDGPLQPLAVTLTVANPLNAELKLTVAVAPVPVTVFPVPVTVQL